MVNRSGFRVEGLRDVVRGLQQMGLDVDDLKDAFAKLAAKGSEVASQLAPRRSGRLAGDVRGNRAKSKAVITAGRATVPYAGPINYGWPKRGIEPSLFMQRADEQMQPTAVQLLEDEINTKIQEKHFR
ncbi:hypothetical protein [Nocardioides bruguierae]|uniref:HK97 gp10 family phage protein n=1 Tax=Nocardioides bruguierae TaxID=2945102 RepID=A0A9X2D3M5_9ACTN|nr:hypothetical protein [Nocardioides bruguierae]MCM0618777.1 hypothetical protein [Nocardioides bruguierae]